MGNYLLIVECQDGTCEVYRNSGEYQIDACKSYTEAKTKYRNALYQKSRSHSAWGLDYFNGKEIK